MDARKNKLSVDEALALVKAARRLYVAKGKKVLEFDMQKSPPPDEDLRKLITGPTGNVRAPILRRGNKVFVGFNEELLASKL
ncbi:MAG: hypothetical protein D6725_05620 [Planctomycetota bacterium]|nr:MAG: hypothetical protein D6725_05620 [Planctomycetota bacterium]